MEEVYRGVWVIAYREILRFVRQRSRMISSLAMPLLFLAIFGAGFNRIVGDLTEGIDFLTFIYPGIIAMTVLMTSLFSGISVVWDREFGFLREVMVAPMNRGGVVMGKAVGAAAVALAQAVVLLALAPLLDISLSPLLVLKLIPVVLVVSLSLSSMGILIGSMMRSQQGYQMVMQLLILPLMFLSGVFFPVDNVPAWLQVVAKANPVTYGADAIRQLFLGGESMVAEGDSSLGVTVFGHTMSVLEDALVVGALGLVLMAAAVWSFNRQE